MAEPKDTPIVEADTTVARVTLFEDRAEVVRNARVAMKAGRARVHARGVTLLVDDPSVACKVTSGAAQVVFTRVRRRAEDVTEATAAEVLALEAELERARFDLARVDRALEQSGADAARIDAMVSLWGDTAASVPSRADESTEELDRAFDALEAATSEVLDRRSRLAVERAERAREAARASRRLEQGRATKPRFEAFVELELDIAEDGEVALELTYRTPCALWRPEHLARLRRTGEGEGEITLTTYATIWQRTGEVWRDVDCRFSTARPAKGGSAPLLTDDVLETRKKSDAERRQIVVEAREQVISAAGAAGGVRDVDEMPGVDDGGEARWLEGRAPATIESDGRPVRVEIGERVFPCAVARVAFPELGPAAHVRATATLPGPGPLLAGPVALGREAELVGRASVGFVGAGEPFELGFGVDDGLRVRRNVIEKRRTTPVTGTQHAAREVRLYVSNLGGDTRTLSVLERVPVSEVEDVEVFVDEARHMRHDARDGFVTFDLELRPREERELVLTYRIEAASNVVLPASLDG